VVEILRQTVSNYRLLIRLRLSSSSLDGLTQALPGADTQNSFCMAFIEIEDKHQGESMPISGIVVTCTAANAENVALQLVEVHGVEVHAVLPDGKIVAVVEADTVEGEVELVTGLGEIEGVVSVQLAYHNFEQL